MNENSPDPGLNESDLLELALRLVRYPGDSRTQNAQLLPGQLPDPLPVTIPFPEDSRVLGSLARNPESITIYLDTYLNPGQILTFYRQHMEVEGWQTTSVHRPHRGGFMHSGSERRGGNETFYKGLHDAALAGNTSESYSAWGDDGNRNRSGPVLVVNAYPGRGGATDLRLSLEMNGPFPPGPPPHLRRRPSRNTSNYLPALEAPEGANYAGGSSRGGHDSVSVDTTLVMDIDLSTLAAHYKTQLKLAGCILTDEGQGGPLAWMNWTLEEDGEQWRGILIILKEIDQEYFLRMSIKNDKQGQATTGASRE